MLAFIPIATILLNIMIIISVVLVMDTERDEPIGFGLSVVMAVICFTFILGTSLNYAKNYDRVVEELSQRPPKTNIDSLYNEAYKKGQIDCQKGKILWEKTTNDQGEIRWNKISMLEVEKSNYKLLLSYNPCDLFTYFNTSEMHGVNCESCNQYNNSKSDAYITGLTNYIPNENNIYKQGDEMFIFINLSRCTNDIETTKYIMHELMHRGFELYNYDINEEENIISWAENETNNILKEIKNYKMVL